MTTTTTEPAEPIATMEIRRTVAALVVDGAAAYVAAWRENSPTMPDDVRVVVEFVDVVGRSHHSSLSPETAAVLLAQLTGAHAEAVELVGRLS